MDKVTVQVADRLSDRIVDVVNAELVAMREANRISPLSLLSGQLLALMALLKMAPPFNRPTHLDRLERSVRACLHELLEMSDLRE